jgi:hypothetical protein
MAVLRWAAVVVVVVVGGRGGHVEVGVGGRGGRVEVSVGGRGGRGGRGRAGCIACERAWAWVSEKAGDGR